jgi:ubiquinone/menaquinone biosynthesis C-methylase UbiE
MTEEDLKSIAEQLRKPNGIMAKDSGEKMNDGNRMMNTETIKELVLEKNDQILEIGMGNGFFVKKILENDKTISYTGCDFSKEMVAEAKRMNAQFIEKRQAFFNHGDAHDLPYKTGIFDTVLTVNTIYFWKDAHKVLSEIRRVLCENGKLVISLRPKSVMEDFPITKFGFQTFSRNDMEKLLSQNGFSIEKIIERTEPDLEFFGEKLKNKFMIIRCCKN